MGRSRFQGWAIDVRYVWRVLAASPVFAAVAILSLAIGIGANTVLFSVARFALLDPLPVDDPDELRIVQWSGPAKIEVSQYNSGGSTDPATGRAIRTNYTYPAARQLEARQQTADLFAFNFVSQLTVVVELDDPCAHPVGKFTLRFLVAGELDPRVLKVLDIDGETRHSAGWQRYVDNSKHSPFLTDRRRLGPRIGPPTFQRGFRTGARALLAGGVDQFGAALDDFFRVTALDGSNKGCVDQAEG